MKNVNYEIVKMEITEEACGAKFGIALGHNEETNMWVTWGFQVDENNNNEISFFWGHYYEREVDAIINYHQRIIENLK